MPKEILQSIHLQNEKNHQAKLLNEANSSDCIAGSSYQATLSEVQHRLSGKIRGRVDEAVRTFVDRLQDFSHNSGAESNTANSLDRISREISALKSELSSSTIENQPQGSATGIEAVLAAGLENISARIQEISGQQEHPELQDRLQAIGDRLERLGSSVAELRGQDEQHQIATEALLNLTAAVERLESKSIDLKPRIEENDVAPTDEVAPQSYSQDLDQIHQAIENIPSQDSNIAIQQQLEVLAVKLQVLEQRDYQDEFGTLQLQLKKVTEGLQDRVQNGSEEIHGQQLEELSAKLSEFGTTLTEIATQPSSDTSIQNLQDLSQTLENLVSRHQEALLLLSGQEETRVENLQENVSDGLQEIRSTLEALTTTREETALLEEKVSSLLERWEAPVEAPASVDLSIVEQRLEEIETSVNVLAGRVSESLEAEQSQSLDERLEQLESTLEQLRQLSISQHETSASQIDEQLQGFSKQLGELENKGTDELAIAELRTQLAGLEQRLLAAADNQEAEASLDQRLLNLSVNLEQLTTAAQAGASCADLTDLLETAAQQFDGKLQQLTHRISDESLELAGKLQAFEGRLNDHWDVVLDEIRTSNEKNSEQSRTDSHQELERFQQALESKLTDTASGIVSELQSDDQSSQILQRLDQLEQKLAEGLGNTSASLAEDGAIFVNELKRVEAKLCESWQATAQDLLAQNDTSSDEDIINKSSEAQLMGALQLIEDKIEQASDNTPILEAMQELLAKQELPDNLLDMPDLLVNLRKDFALLVHTINKHLEASRELADNVSRSVVNAINTTEAQERAEALQSALITLESLKELPSKIAETLQQ